MALLDHWKRHGVILRADIVAAGRDRDTGRNDHAAGHVAARVLTGAKARPSDLEITENQPVSKIRDAVDICSSTVRVQRADLQVFFGVPKCVPVPPKIIYRNPRSLGRGTGRTSIALLVRDCGVFSKCVPSASKDHRDAVQVCARTPEGGSALALLSARHTHSQVQKIRQPVLRGQAHHGHQAHGLNRAHQNAGLPCKRETGSANANASWGACNMASGQTSARAG